MTIPFSKPSLFESALINVQNSLNSGRTSGDHQYTKQCRAWIQDAFHVKTCLLTTSGTHALELAALTVNIQPGDEVIMPSFTFSSTANAFVLRGAKICFVDINPDTMNLDEQKTIAAINSKTKAIVLVHYAGWSCDIDQILTVANAKNIVVIEDAAQAFSSKYKDKYLGAITDFGCFSFHETKNISCGEGGALLLNDDKYSQSAEILREKGTNRVQFFRGEVDKYTWQDYGSSFLLSDICAAVLYSQLANSELILKKRTQLWNSYFDLLSPLKNKGIIGLPFVPQFNSINGHIFYIKVKNIDERSSLLAFLKSYSIHASFHYVPLHSAPAGLKYGYFFDKDEHTTVESERLLRLPLYYDMTKNDTEKVTELIEQFYRK